MDGFFDLLTFFSTPFGLTATGLAAAAIILFWEWRLALVGLGVVQVGVATVIVQVEQAPAEWAGVMTAVTGLACLILMLSASQAPAAPSMRQAGTWQLRALALVLVYLGWRAFGHDIRIPGLVSQVTSLFVWLSICVVVILGLSENPLFTAVALLLWCVPVQAVVAVMLGIPALIALIGIVELVVALACSYLVLAEQLPATERQPVLTDIAFPDQLPAYGARPQRPIEPPSPGWGLREGALGWWRRAWGAARPVLQFRSPYPPRPAPDQPQGRAVLARKRQ
ncbi:MAG TPA: hypothetical protein VNK95_17695 [Caldilineaceae bacterium]|nr:hypothetical protein [Caldilineaceae bacterium]